MYMREEKIINGYHFGLCCAKAKYNKMNLNSKTYQTLCFIKYNPWCHKSDVQKFVYGEKKYSSYGSFVWKNILADGLVSKSGSGNNIRYLITPLGESYIDYINRNSYKNK
jgi:hypothetical protein